MKPLCFAVAVLLSFSTFLPPVHPRERCPVLHAPEGAEKTGCYIVMVKEGTSMEKYESVMATVVGISEENKLYGSVRRVAMAFTVKLSDSALMEARAIPDIKFIEEETMVMAMQSPTPWHLDRISQTQLPLDGRYDPVGTGEGVDIYILDTGIRYEHEEFESRAKYSGYDPADAYYNQTMQGRDCNGHGSHVASLAGSKTFGSAKKVTIYSVRVLNCFGSAPWSIVLDGLEHSLESILQRKRPAVVSMSLSGAYAQSVEDSVQRLHSFRITIVVAAGNYFNDACRRSPASSDYAITVGGTAIDDDILSVTNYGSCVDIFAPGFEVLGVDHRCNICTKFLSGTSMACPVVSGAAAILLGREPSLTPDEVKQRLLENATENVLDFQRIPESARSMTPNKLVQVEIQGVFPTYQGSPIRNHEVGTHKDVGTETLARVLGCETDNSSCCGDSDNPNGRGFGQWYYPNGARVAYDLDELPDGEVYIQQRGPQIVRLLRVVDRGRVTPAANGIYRCEVPDKNGVIQTCYVGLYTETTKIPNGVGVISISHGPYYSLISDNPLVFTLTTITTGGPPADASWTLPNGMTLLPTSQIVLNYESSTVIHTLAVTEDLPGDYTFSATNRRSGLEMSSITVRHIERA